MTVSYFTLINVINYPGGGAPYPGGGAPNCGGGANPPPPIACGGGGMPPWYDDGPPPPGGATEGRGGIGRPVMGKWNRKWVKC